jgi:hypothetical protein
VVVNQGAERGIRFLYQGAEGQRIHLSGSFTAWDPFLYALTETRPGRYETTIPLPPGEYQYLFVQGFTEFADPANPERVFSSDGRSASVLRVR